MLQRSNRRRRRERKKDIEAVKESLKAIQKDLQGIKVLPQSRPIHKLALLMILGLTAGIGLILLVLWDGFEILAPTAGWSEWRNTTSDNFAEVVELTTSRRQA